MGCVTDPTEKRLELIFMKSVEYKLKLGEERWLNS